jgi:uncharacterized protein
MPLIPKSNYAHSLWIPNPHMQTIWPSLFRNIEGVIYSRERVLLSDNDFTDLDWIKSDNKKLVVLAHGLEGNSNRHYMKGMAKYFHHHGWDVLAWNCRSCSGEINKAPRLYHHAATDDLVEVIEHANRQQPYEEIALVGFSMGGSLILKYLGEGNRIPNQIKSSAVFSVPCNLGDSAALLDQPKNSFYRKRFINKLKKKVKLKSEQYPAIFDATHLEKIKYFEEFDELYTAPAHGFKSAQEFYNTASAIHYIPQIEIPTLIVNAANDPFLPESCYPRDIVEQQDQVFLEIPKTGGHVGFGLSGKPINYMEVRALDFISETISIS